VNLTLMMDGADHEVTPAPARSPAGTVIFQTGCLPIVPEPGTVTRGNATGRARDPGSEPLPSLSRDRPAARAGQHSAWSTPCSWSPIALVRLRSVTSTKCWSCGVTANMTPVPGSGTRRDYHVGSDGFVTKVMACFRCDSCGWLSLGLNEFEGIVEFQGDVTDLLTFSDGLRWLPPDASSKPYPDVPNEIAATASEAHKCMVATGSYRAAVLLARAVIEATAKDKGITTGRLSRKIDAMHDARLIREDVRDGAHEVRYLGNDMAHGDFIEPVLREDAELVLVLMDEVLEEVYQSPARVRRRREARLAKATETGSKV